MPLVNTALTLKDLPPSPESKTGCPIKKILLVDLCILGEQGGGHGEFYFMTILSILTQEYDLVYCCSGNNDLLRQNLKKDDIKRCQVVDIEVTLLDKAIRRSLMLFDFFLGKIPLKKYIKFSSLINLLTVRRILTKLDKRIPVFFVHTDSMMPAVPLSISKFFFPKQWIGLVILPSYKLKITDGHETSRRRFNGEKNFSLTSCKGILVLQPLYINFFLKRFKNLNCFYLPELVSINHQNDININTSLLDYIKQKSNGKKIVSLLGKITLRKNLPLFLESVSKLNLDKYFILVLGKIHDPNPANVSKNLIENNKLIDFYNPKLGNSCYIDINYFIKNEAEFCALIQMTDIVYLHYKKYPFSSNILAKSMAYGKLVIVNKGSIMEKTLLRYKWQTAVEECPDKIANAIDNVSDQKLDEECISSFLLDHSPEKVQSVILQASKDLNII